MEQVLKFLSGSKNNAWVRVGKINVYVRKGRHFINDEVTSCFDLANISVVKANRGKGIFAQFLTDLELILVERNDGLSCIYVENVINPKFACYLSRCGFIQTGGATPTLPSFYRALPLYGERAVQ